MILALLVTGTVFCAFHAIRAKRLLASALWLAAVSALLAITLYRLGAREIAVIELSVGAGLVSVLLVVALNIVGDETAQIRQLVPRPLAMGLVTVVAIILGAMLRPREWIAQRLVELSFATVLWTERSLDVFTQIVLIFAGTLGVLGLLAQAPQTHADAGAQTQVPLAEGEILRSAEPRPNGHRLEPQHDREEARV